MGLTLITAPSSEPVNTDQAKAWLRIDSDAEIDTIQQLITVARQKLDGRDGYLNRALETQTWKLTLDRLPQGRELDIPLPPLQSVTSIQYLDSTGAQQTFSSDYYRVIPDDWRGRVVLNIGACWPATLCEPASVEVVFVAGYANGIPDALKMEILGLVGVWFDSRDQVGQIPDDWQSNFRLVPYA